jgi:hypothetical protein
MEESFDQNYVPTLSQVVSGEYYESQLFWFSRHILAASVTVPEEDAEEEESVERMVVPLAGVEKVFVVTLDVAAKGKQLEQKTNLGKFDPSAPGFRALHCTVAELSVVSPV